MSGDNVVTWGYARSLLSHEETQQAQGSGKDRSVSTSDTAFDVNEDDTKANNRPAKKRTVKTDVHAEQDAIAFAAKRVCYSPTY